MEIFENLEIQVNNVKYQYLKLLELCMYALIKDTEIYNHMLDDINKLTFMIIILENLDSDTETIKKKIIES